MTTPATARKAGPLLGNGSQTAWPFAFKVFAEGDIAVTIADADGVETLLVLDTDYSVALNGNQDTSPGGTVTYPISGAELPTGSVLAIVGSIGYDQPLDLPSGGNFSPLAIENQFDRTAMQVQQLREELDRSARLPVTSAEDADALVADIVRLADSADNIDTVAGSIASVNTVATNIANVNTVASVAGGVAAIGANTAAVVAVGNDLLEPTSEINTVAVSITNVNAVGTDIANVNTVAGIAADVTAVAGNATDISAVADIAADITNFADVYQGAKAADPTLRNDTSALQAGDLYFNTTNGEMRVFGGTLWKSGFAGAISVDQLSGDGVETEFVLPTAPASENNTQIYIDGVYQQKDQYSVSGATITFSAAPPAGTNNIEVVTVGTLALGVTDAALVSYTPAGTGAVATTVQAKLRELITVLDKGAVGDNSTDCLAAFTATLADHPGAAIRLPAGNYRIPFSATTALSIPTGTVIEGDGKDNTTITFVPDSTTLRFLMVASGDGVTFRNLKIVCECPAGGQFAVISGGVSKITFQDCELDGATTDNGAALSHSAYMILYPASGTQTDHWFDGCDIHNFAFPVLKANANTSAQKRITFSHCDFYNNYGEDLSFNSPNGSMSDVQVYMCNFRDGLRKNISLAQIYVAFASVTNFRVGGCSFEGDVGAAGQAIHIEEGCIGGTIAGNTINCTGYGVMMSGNNVGGVAEYPSQITITGNSFVKGGTAKAAGSIGIGLVTSGLSLLPANRLIITDNTIANYEIGFYSWATLDDACSVTGNLIDNCTSGMSFRDASCVSGNITANCTTGLVANASASTAVDSAVIDDHTFINCTTNVDATEMPITLSNPKWIFPEFDHAGGGTSVYKDCMALGASDRLHGFMEISLDSDLSTNHSKIRDEVTWDGTTFTRTNKLTIQPGSIQSLAARNSSILAVQVFASGVAKVAVRVQAKLNGMAVVAV